MIFFKTAIWIWIFSVLKKIMECSDAIQTTHSFHEYMFPASCRLGTVLVRGAGWGNLRRGAWRVQRELSWWELSSVLSYNNCSCITFYILESTFIYRTLFGPCHSSGDGGAETINALGIYFTSPLYHVEHDWTHLPFGHRLLSGLLWDFALIIFFPSPWMQLRF